MTAWHCKTGASKTYTKLFHHYAKNKAHMQQTACFMSWVPNKIVYYCRRLPSGQLKVKSLETPIEFSCAQAGV
jgi:hypothetical protein